jgi:hypothetical protein
VALAGGGHIRLYPLDVIQKLDIGDVPLGRVQAVENLGRVAADLGFTGQLGALAYGVIPTCKKPDLLMVC